MSFIYKYRNMNQTLFQFDMINGLLVENASSISGVGLFNGKLGLSIYFFTLAREIKNPEYQEIAEILIGEVYNSVGEATILPDFEDGLAGIAWGICYLVRNEYVDAELDEILSELDDRIYKYLIENRGKLPVNLRQGLLGYLYYYTYRLESTPSSGDKVNKYIFQMICTDIINQLGQQIEEEKFHSREPILFTIFWDLPVLLILLANAKKSNINPNKVNRILDYLTNIVISLYPKLHSNRLYLLLGMEKILSEIPIPEWRTHADFLRKAIEPSKMILEECRNLNILVMDGISGLAFISKKFAELTDDSELLLSEVEVIKKIKGSVYWDDSEFYKEMKIRMGLCTGMSGIGLLLLEYLKDKREVKLI